MARRICSFRVDFCFIGNLQRGGGFVLLIVGEFEDLMRQTVQAEGGGR